jgi:hypothetical protein
MMEKKRYYIKFLVETENKEKLIITDIKFTMEIVDRLPSGSWANFP